MEKKETPESESHLVPIRRADFSRNFWSFWGQLRERPKAAYVLGRLKELETALRALSERVRKIEEQVEDLPRQAGTPALRQPQRR